MRISIRDYALGKMLRNYIWGDKMGEKNLHGVEAERAIIRQLEAEIKRLRRVLGNCRDTLILCELIDKSGQAKASADMAEQVLKE